MKILVSGATGYIGSHTVVELINAGFKVVAVDNLTNSSLESLKRVEKLSKCKIPFYKLDIRNKSALKKVFDKHSIEAVIHFAGLKSVNESFLKPVEYYNNNLGGTFSLIEVMKEFNCKIFLFSSSASVYGDPQSIPIKENVSLSGSNPYSRSKIMIEQYLQDVFNTSDNCYLGILRYFNPIGAHKSGLIGEDPNDIPNNLIPFVSKVAIRKIKKLYIFGGDYETPDGTGIRDYIHVVDLAIGHIKALQVIMKKPQVLIANLGTGKGYSVLDVVKAFEKTSGRHIPFSIVDRRQGDIAISYADCNHANKILNWKAKYKLDEMCEDAWRWQTLNPKGYN